MFHLINWGLLFLSDIVTADGHPVECLFFTPPTDNDLRKGTLEFPEEWPTTADWKVWEKFWTHVTLSGGLLHQ